MIIRCPCWTSATCRSRSRARTGPTVSVKAATVNHHDLWSLQGVGLAESQTPMILGTDAAGILDEDIPGRNGLKDGSEVVLYTVVGNDGCGVMPGGAPHDPVRVLSGYDGREDRGAQRERVRQAREPDDG